MTPATTHRPPERPARGAGSAAGIDRTQIWAILRLGWTLSRRRWGRQSPLLGGIAVLLVVLGIGSSVGAFVLAYILGIAFLPELEPASVLYLWDGVIVGFLLAWIAGLLLQLQLRGEALSLGKLLPMPVPLASAFLVNYVGSQLRVSLLIFLGLMLGLALASVSALGASNLILIPLARISHHGRLSAFNRASSWVSLVSAMSMASIVPPMADSCAGRALAGWLLCPCCTRGQNAPARMGPALPLRRGSALDELRSRPRNRQRQASHRLLKRQSARGRRPLVRNPG